MELAVDSYQLTVKPTANWKLQTSHWNPQGSLCWPEQTKRETRESEGRVPGTPEGVP